MLEVYPAPEQASYLLRHTINKDRRFKIYAIQSNREDNR